MLHITRKYSKNIGRLFLTAADNILVVLFRKKKTRGPVFISWDIAGSCNVKCVMCDKWKSSADELSTAEKLSVVRQAGAAGVWMLSLCGGEPFLLKDLKEVAAAAKEAGLLVNISTNGLLLLDNLPLMESVDFLTVSIDSHRAEFHDAWRGKKGLFDRALKGIEALRGLRRRPFTSVRQVVTKANMRDADEYISFWKDKVDEILFQPIQPSDALGFSVPDELMPGGRSDADDEARFNQALERHGLMNGYNAGICDFLFRKEEVRKDFDCRSGYFSLDMDSAGNLYNCGDHMYELGNLTRDDLLASLNGKDEGLRTVYRDNQCLCYYNCAMINIYVNGIERLFRSRNG